MELSGMSLTELEAYIDAGEHTDQDVIDLYKELMSVKKYATGGIINTDHLTKIGEGKEEVVLQLDGIKFGETLKDALAKFPKFHAYKPDSIKGRIFEYFNKQTEKGVNKYGHTLDDCPDEKFDWRLMIIEELVDCIQYQQKEIVRLERLLNPADEAN